jgi:hypothetical protein
LDLVNYFKVITADLFGFEKLAIHEQPFSSASLRLRANVKCFYFLSLARWMRFSKGVPWMDDLWISFLTAVLFDSWTYGSPMDRCSF